MQKPKSTKHNSEEVKDMLDQDTCYQDIQDQQDADWWYQLDLEIQEQLEKEKYYIQNFECVNTKYPLFDKTKHLEDRKNLREKNKENINAERREKIECHICNKMISKYNMKRHLESSAHSKTIMTPEERKIKRNEKALENIECSHCNKLFCRSSLKRHILRKHGI